MIVSDLIKYIEDWAPPGVAWERDNVGLQVGSSTEKLKNVMLCLELTDKVLKQALQKNCNFIFTHHPFIFHPIKNIDSTKDSKSKLIDALIKNDITVYSAHTNLDFTIDGVSFELAKTLGLKNIQFLQNEVGNQYKIVVFVPEQNLENVSNAIFNSGGGIIGEYKNCSFRQIGSGTFLGSEKSNPAIGRKEKFETVDEVRLEVLVNSWDLNKVLNAINKIHPYEEPAIDIYQLRNTNVNYGAGAIGDLTSEISFTEFLNYISTSLKISNYKYSGYSKKSIKRVAVCGGSGSELLNVAIANNADAFITADVKYHTFHEAENKILLIDAGHYETEILALNAVEKKLKPFLNINSKEEIKLYRYSGSTNPVKFYKQ